MIQNGFSDSLPNTDLYQLTAVLACAWSKNRKDIVTCEASACALPPQRRFLVMAGTEEIKNLLLNLRFTDADIELIRQLEPFKSILNLNFEQYLKDFRFTGDFWAMAEGEIVFAGEPLVRITGPVPEVMLAESCVLPILNHAIPVASKAARLVLASRGKPVIDIGTRKMYAQVAASTARAAYLAGFSATSNVVAIAKYGIPAAGVMLHPWILLHENEEEAFKVLNKVCRNPSIVIDANDVWSGTILASELMSTGDVIIESVDPTIVAGGIRKILDAKDRRPLKIMAYATDEYEIDRICKSGAPIDGFLVGNGLNNQCCEPIDVTYDIVYNDTAQKPLVWAFSKNAVLPGKKQVFLDQRNGSWSHLVALESSVVPKGEDLIPLLDRHILNGKLCDDSSVDLEVARKYCNAELLSLHQGLSSLELKTEEDVPVYAHQDLKDLFDLATNKPLNRM
jgi:nicotinate phosphoribosyltransferase